MKFEVYINGKPAQDFALHGAYLFGPDMIPFRSSGLISFNNGIIEISRKSAESTGIAILWSVEGFGKMLLPTTRLPERETPYNLNVELARAKLMEITIKREDWAAFDDDESMLELVQQAQNYFIASLQHINDSAKASLLADKSLMAALAFSEKLTKKHADTLFEQRLKSRGFSRASLGCQIDPAKAGDANYIKGLSEVFSRVSIPVNWAKIETKKGCYDFSELENCIEAFGKLKMVICVGPVVCFRPDMIPGWLFESKPGFEQIREAVFNFIGKIVEHFNGRVHAWQVIGEINMHNCLKFSFERIIEITRTAILASRQANGRSSKIIDIACPWGEYFAIDQDSLPPLVYVDMVTQAGVNFDGFGLRMMFGKNSPGMHVRDMMQISAMLDRFVMVAKPIHITAVSVPASAGSEDYDCQVAGMWRREWDQTVQSEWIERFFRMALSKPFVSTVTYAAFSDGDMCAPAGSGLASADLRPKKSLVTLEKFQKLLLKKAN